ncbi:MAG TPA: SdpI family protein [Caulobacteraceae bacterium]|jgi:uncharacterized membrane protein
MKVTLPVAISLGLVAFTVALAVWGYVVLPADATIAIHYTGLDGRSHPNMPKGPGLALLPAVSAIVLISVATSTRVLGRRRWEGTAEVRGLLVTTLAALFLVAEGALIAQGLNPRFDAFRWIFMAAALLLLLVGNALGKVRHNFALGVRTYWTLSDARVWDKTHRFTGRVMVLGALALAAFCAFAPNHGLLIATLVLAAAGPVVAGAVYSARIAARED